MASRWLLADGSPSLYAVHLVTTIARYTALQRAGQEVQLAAMLEAQAARAEKIDTARQAKRDRIQYARNRVHDAVKPARGSWTQLDGRPLPQPAAVDKNKLRAAAKIADDRKRADEADAALLRQAGIEPTQERIALLRDRRAEAAARAKLTNYDRVKLSEGSMAKREGE